MSHESVEIISGAGIALPGQLAQRRNRRPTALATPELRRNRLRHQFELPRLIT